MSLYCVTGMLGEKKEYDLKNKSKFIIVNSILTLTPFIIKH